MVDLVGIGVSGLAAYQRALGTTSNNIANLQTEGYVRQRAVLETAGQDNSSRISLGNGVRFAQIQRLYDRFAEENLQRASSDLKGEEVLLTELQSLQDALGSSEAGLHGAFQAFFDAARNLEAAPGSSGIRAGFLAAAEGVASRFRGLGSTAQMLDGTTQTQIDQAVAEANSLMKELAGLNMQLVKRATDAEQPMQLLDRRDAVLKSLSERIGITVSLSDSGAATVYAGESASGVALVESNRARILSVSFDDFDYGKVQFVLDAASQPTVLSNVQTGTLGGLVRFRGQALGPAAETLDRLALSFGREVNKLHSQGLDSTGRPGGDLFYVGPDFAVDGRANAGTSRLGVTVLDPTSVQPNSYEMRFDGNSGRWTVRNLQTGDIATGRNDLELDGLRFSTQGVPANGDTFRIAPESRPAVGFRTLIREPAEVASASKIMTTAGLGNLSTATADVALADVRIGAEFRGLDVVIPRTSGPPYSETTVSASRTPIAVIKAGTRNIALTTAGDSGQLAVFTRDGRQLSGPAMASSVVTAANGFYESAVYSSDYLNKTGASAYLDMAFVHGMHAVSGAQTAIDGTVIRTPARIETGSIDLSSISTAGSLTLRFNGIVKTFTIPDPVTTANLASLINAEAVDTGVVAEVVNNERLIFKSYNATKTAASDVAASGYVTLNGVRVATDTSLGAGETWATNLASNINGAKIGVFADVLDGELVLTNSTGRAGEPFSIGENSIGLSVGSRFNASALSIDFDPDTTTSTVLNTMGLRRGFAATEPFAEDLLIFGVNTSGTSADVRLSGTYTEGSVPAALKADARRYDLVFDSSNVYQIFDTSTNTIVAEGQMDLTTRTIRYGNWAVTMGGLPADGDRYTIQPTDEPLGDNRVAAAIARIQSRRDLTPSGQTVQEEYEGLVNRTGALTVQAEVGRNAQKVVFDHARESRDKVSGVNLDEELSDLLRFQQAYQANAQVIQTANRIFDSLLQRL